jgi:GrpB-like predicted nucleotidyltransferase (UPF0157 family)
MAKSHRGEVKLYPYQDQWRKAFLKERKVLERELAGRIHAVEHIGSTAVPGMSALLVIDILVGLDDLAEIEGFEEVLRDMGYSPSPTRSHGTGHRLWAHEDQQGFHLHFTAARTLGATPYVRFRDALIRDAKLAKDYKEHKIRLVGNYKCDLAWYTAEKSKWIASRMGEILRNGP